MGVASHLPGHFPRRGMKPLCCRRTRPMSHITSMIETHPNTTSDLDVAKLADCIAACFECAQTCTACADACLGEEMVTELRNCIRQIGRASCRGRVESSVVWVFGRTRE